jgi:DNA repair protein RadA/Sms
VAKTRTQFVCQACGTVHARWAGKCDGCGEWNTIVEDDPTPAFGGGPPSEPPHARGALLRSPACRAKSRRRRASRRRVSELDRVTGGGFVRGSAVLVGGDPGIGKSTLLMQAAAALARQGHRVIYVSGEEAVAQVRLRAQRLGAADTGVLLAAETNVEDILATLAGRQASRISSSSIRSRRCGAIWPARRRVP